MKVTLPEHVSELLNDIPEQEKPKGEEDAFFWRAVACELAQMTKYASRVLNPEIVLTKMRKAGSQYIWEFYVNDLSLPRRDAYNWHGQNVSQWLYAGCVLVSNGQVSTHH